jgi:diguanylate cyclase (GGDEF)-like protein
MEAGAVEVVETKTNAPIKDAGERPSRRLDGARLASVARDPGTWVVAAMGLLAAVYLIWQRLGWGGADRRTIISDGFFLPLGWVGALLSFRAARSDRLDKRTRRAWVVIGIALACYGLGDTLWFYFENFTANPPFPSLADAWYLAFYALLLVGLLLFPVGARQRTDRLKFWLDIGTVLLSTWMVVWFFVIAPTARAGADTSLGMIISQAYPVGDLVLVFGIAAIILRKPTESSRRALTILAVGLGLFVIADIGFGYASLHTEFKGGDWPDSIWMVAQYIMIFAAYYQHRRAAQKQDDQPRRPLPTARVSRLPYAAIGIAFSLLLVVSRHESPYPLGALIMTSVGITVLVLARQITVMRENARLMATLHWMATTDALTGLRNRGEFFNMAELEYERARRFNTPLAAMMLDIDHFKELNDRYGHAGGDAVLHAVASTCLRRLRSFDMVGRYGGDEFIALLPEVEVQSALAVAERLSVAVRGTPVLVGDDVIPVSLSIGLAFADHTARNETLAELLHRADLALYEAKAAGRNCVRFVGSDAPTTP